MESACQKRRGTEIFKTCCMQAKRKAFIQPGKNEMTAEKNSRKKTKRKAKPVPASDKRLPL
ncbi:hypothetical protein CHL76_07025 [Marinococcus halophilus]|nr:hypothetical protein CHL76_07025 [Marinococcus halophilus]